MGMISKELIQNYLKDKKLIQEEIRKTFIKFYKIGYGRELKKGEVIEKITFDDKTAFIKIFRSNIQGYHKRVKYINYEFPIEYVYSKKWEKEIQRRVEEAKNKLKEKERKMFEELKEKYD